MQTPAPPPVAEHAAPTATNRRLNALVVVHAILCASPMLALLLPQNLYTLPLLWISATPGVGALMTLSFWLGMGGGRSGVRVLLAAAGAAYIALWSTLFNWVGAKGSLSVAFEQFAVTASLMGGVVGVFGLSFLLARKWLTLVKLETPDDDSPRDWLQYSVLHLLVAMTLGAFVLAFVTLSRSNAAAESSLVKLLLVWAVGYGIFFANTLFAAHAALGRKPLLPRIAIAVLVAMILGVAISLASRHDVSAWWLVPCGAMIVVVPTTIVIVSLLVVRSCGYRLVRRRSVADELLPFQD
jgi:hypothetical protein